MAINQPMKENDADPAGNLRHAAADVKADQRANALSGHRIEYLGPDLPAFAFRDSCVGVAAESILKSIHQTGVFQLVEKARLDLESHGIERVDEPKIDHHADCAPANTDVDPIATVRCGLPRNGGHLSESF